MHLSEGRPPSRPISSTPIALKDATRMLETYLSNSELHPHLHPDPVFTSRGFTFASASGSQGGLVMHNLRRLAAGMRGEYMEPEVTPEPEDANSSHMPLNGAGGAKSTGGILKHNGVTREEDIEGWMDKEDYEREEGGIEIGDIGRRDTGVRQGGGETEVQITGGPELGGGKKGQKRKTSGLGEEDEAGEGAGDENGAGGDGRVVDKEARKKAKKERKKKEQQEKEKQRAKGKQREPEGKREKKA